ncbi:hypothetical protein M569_04053 [Genlisea aurea]|uniref:Uncharacterized protein n=1 Tax=Genlisea aurea TaxID=192259 RepID=S8E4L2_9LAMI|nr:hypothetical protein M569_04053 [Genlisea aurea]
MAAGEDGGAYGVDSISLEPTPAPVISNTVIPPNSAPITRPHIAQSGDFRSSAADSENEDSGPSRIAKASNQEYQVSEESKLARDRQEKVVQELMTKRRAAALAVPTNDNAVRARLRRLGQLDKLMKADEDEEAAVSTAAAPSEHEEDMREIAKYSLVKAAKRLSSARRKIDDPDEDLDAEIEWSLKQAAGLVLECRDRLAMIGRSRDVPSQMMGKLLQLGNLRFSFLLTGVAKLWSMPGVNFRGQETAKLWNAQGTALRTFKGHLDRLSFHPMGNFLGTASFDRTWRLWDVETGQELLLQEGHSRSVCMGSIFIGMAPWQRLADSMLLLVYGT